MKKTTIILAGLALIAASCAKTEVVSSGPEGGEKGISFSAYTARPTKAQDVTTSNLKSFKATAIGNSAVYFNGVTFNKNSTTAVWESTPAYFWPAYALDFYAYNTPEKGTFTPTINTESQTILVAPSTTLSEQEDLVAACVKSANEPTNKGATAISFHHYLTQVVLKAKCSNSNYTVKVDGIKLANLAGEGTYTFSTSAETAGNMVATTGKVNSDDSVDYSADITQVELSSNVSAELGRWYLIPQTVKSWDKDNNMTNTEVSSSSSSITGTYDYGTYLALKVLITSKGGANIYPYSGTTSAWMAVPVPTDLAFAQGKKYNVTVDFFSTTGNGAGYVDPEDPGELDGDSGTKDNGKAIVGGVIKFSATVDTWGDSVNITISR